MADEGQTIAAAHWREDALKPLWNVGSNDGFLKGGGLVERFIIAYILALQPRGLPLH